MKTWKSTIDPHIKKWEAASKKLFDAFEKEKKDKKLNTTAAQNEVWNKKYKAKFDKMMAQQSADYAKIWYAYHNPVKK